MTRLAPVWPQAGKSPDPSEAQLVADLTGMRRLYNLHARLANETDLTAALREILAAACEFTGTARGGVQLLSEDGHRLELLVHQGFGAGNAFTEYFRHQGAPAACDEVRRRRERLIIEDVETFPPFQGSRDLEVLRADGIRAVQSTPLITRQGELVGVLNNHFPQPHRPGEDQLRLIDLLAWTAADFVARHRTDLALRESEERFRSFVAASADTVYKMSADWSEMRHLEGKRFLADTPSPSRTWLETYIPARDHPAVRAAIQEAVRHQRPFELEHRVVRADGTVGWTSSRAVPLLNARGQISEWIGAARDVTEHRRAEEALHELDVRYRAMADTAPVLIWEVDENGVIFVNGHYLKFFGVGFEEVRGSGWANFLHPDDAGGCLAAYGQAFGERRSYVCEYRFLRADGQYRWLRNTGQPVGTKRFVGCSVDITDEKRTEAALHVSLDERKALLRELHHRVKNNLQVITSLLEMQARQVRDSEAVASLNEARHRVAAIASIHELLYQSDSLSQVDLGAYARELVPRLVAFYQEQARIEISITGENILVDLDCAVPFGLLLNELISNVCKHAFPPPATGVLTVTVARAEAAIRLHVRDNGVGLPPGFDHRPATTLGLQLVHSLAKQLGGSVVLRTEGGTHAEVCIPDDGKRGGG